MYDWVLAWKIFWLTLAALLLGVALLLVLKFGRGRLLVWAVAAVLVVLCVACVRAGLFL
ncbi:MAG TPA: hypothetical protein VGV38_00940 [Pyrinomonadaceae bacterium]|nr:hypothetical protein [Pyrinomonadaceae bacterium]